MNQRGGSQGDASGRELSLIGSPPIYTVDLHRRLATYGVGRQGPKTIVWEPMPRRNALAPARRARSQTPLSRTRILETAVAAADRDGIDALSMRKLAMQLGVDPMSL